jgi:superkiller protein 3
MYALGIARLQNGEAQRAVDLLKRFIELRPEDSGGYYVLGAALYGLKQFPQARAMLERSVSLEPYPDAEYYLGMIAYNEGDTAQASKWLQGALKAEPNNAAAHTALGMVYAREKNYQAARAELERAMELNPKDATASYQLGLVYARLGEKSLAQSMFATSDKLRAEKEKESVVRFRLVDPPK